MIEAAQLGVALILKKIPDPAKARQRVALHVFVISLGEPIEGVLGLFSDKAKVCRAAKRRCLCSHDSMKRSHNLIDVIRRKTKGLRLQKSHALPHIWVRIQMLADRIISDNPSVLYPFDLS